jgi:hypothetical protein
MWSGAFQTELNTSTGAIFAFLFALLIHLNVDLFRRVVSKYKPRSHASFPALLLVLIPLHVIASSRLRSTSLSEVSQDPFGRFTLKLVLRKMSCSTMLTKIGAAKVQVISEPVEATIVLRSTDKPNVYGNYYGLSLY